MHANQHELKTSQKESKSNHTGKRSGATTKNPLTTEDTKEHEGEPKPFYHWFTLINTDLNRWPRIKANAHEFQNE